MLKSQDTMGNKKCSFFLFQPLKMILSARDTCQLVHQLPLLAKTPVDPGVTRGCATKIQLRGGLLPQTQQFTSTGVTVHRQLSSRNLLFCNLGGRKLQRNEL